MIGCEEISDIITELIIDENKQHALASFRETRTGTKIIESDQNDNQDKRSVNKEKDTNTK